MESDQPGKHMALQSFTKDLYAIGVPLINFASGLGPSFGKLPRELRDQIFSDLIASGHPQFMNVSEMMNTEGKALIYKKGVFRMRYDFDKFKQEFIFRKRPLPTANIVDKIQNLRVRIRSRRNTLPTDVRVYAKAFSRLHMFRDSPLTHGNCTIVFDIAPCCTSKLFLRIARSIEGFTNFDTLVMRMQYDLDANISVPEDSRRALIMSLRDSCFAGMQADFKSHLGKGDIGSDSNGLHMIFHPRKAQRKNAVGDM